MVSRAALLRLAVVLQLWSAAVLSPAWAGTPLLIWPIDPIISPGQNAAALWLENHGPQPAVLQVRVFGWRQDGGEEKFDAQQVVVPSPPIATIAPGRRQLVRLIAAQPAPAGAELPYRIFIDELPTPQPEQTAVAVRLQLRYAVPLFVYGAGAVPPLSRTRDGVGAPDRKALQPDIAWDLDDDGGKPVLVLRNSGPAHGRITAVDWKTADGATTSVNPGLLGYVLPGARMRFPLERPPPPGAALQAQVNGRLAPLARDRAAARAPD